MGYSNLSAQINDLFSQGKNVTEIAKILNVTPQTVLNWHNKFIKFAKKKLTNQ